MVIHSASLALDSAYSKSINTLKITALSISLNNVIHGKSFASLAIQTEYNKSASALTINQVTLSVVNNSYFHQFVSLSLYTKKGFIMLMDIFKGITVLYN